MKKYFATAAVAALCAAGAASAQTTSRLDDVLKAGKLRVCTPGDYKPFSLAKPDGTYEGIDIDLVQSAAKALGVQVEMVKTSWPKLMDDFVEKCDIGVGGISVSTERAKRAGFTTAYMVNGKAPITKCENVSKYQTVADINKPSVTIITNPGGSNERFVRANLPQAKVVVYNDNVTIFDEILKGKADVMISESVETIVQQKLRPGLCAVNPDKPLQYGEMGYLLPRGDTAMKAWFDTWLHLAKASGEYDRTVDKFLK
ncbi:MAG TPA: transporter substrate-binding domain-containing protein [Burkholderiaceae bacterium]|nr:transporter substrate-binding domain-containing protein [Burkholderiaceae bacterium]